MEAKPAKRQIPTSIRAALCLVGLVLAALAFLKGFVMLTEGIAGLGRLDLNYFVWPFLQIAFGAFLIAVGVGIALGGILLFPGPRGIPFVTGVILLAFDIVILIVPPANPALVRLQRTLGVHDFERLWLPGANLRDIGLAEANLSNANLAGSNLAGANLRGADLHGASLAGANLAGSNLRGALLYDADLMDADLSQANLTRSALGSANLTNANLAAADLRWAGLTQANLNGANLTGAKVTTEQLAQAASLEGATMPDGTVHK